MGYTEHMETLIRINVQSSVCLRADRCVHVITPLAQARGGHKSVPLNTRTRAECLLYMIWYVNGVLMSASRERKRRELKKVNDPARMSENQREMEETKSGVSLRLCNECVGGRSVNRGHT